MFKRVSIIKIIFVFITAQIIFQLSGCEKITIKKDEEKESTFLFLYTNDEHGHFYEKGGRYKAAALYEMWDEEEKNCKNCKVFRVSGGDNYTGFAGSSMFNGNSMAEIMNVMEYQVSAVGNHEFDFGMKPFKKNIMLSKMKYISSNVIFNDLKKVFDVSVVFEGLDGNVGFIGATTEDLKQVSFANYIMDAKVVKPSGPVERELRRLKSSTDIQIVVAHDSYSNVLKWGTSMEVKPLIVFNAHSHEKIVKNHNDVLYIQAGRNLDFYARVEVVKKGSKIRVTKADIVPLKKEAHFKLEKSKQIKLLTDKYLSIVDKKAGMKLVEAEEDFDFTLFQKLYACSLLDAYPECDVAMSNPGGFRDSIRKGTVKKSDIISMLPFNNRIVLTEIKGESLIYNLKLAEESYCGVCKTKEGWFKNGKKIDPGESYRVVTHEYVFGGGDYFRFVDDKSESEITSRDWRAPIEKYLYKSSKQGKNIMDSCQTLLKKYDR